MAVLFPELTPSAMQWKAPVYEQVRHVTDDGLVIPQIMLAIREKD